MHRAGKSREANTLTKDGLGLALFSLMNSFLKNHLLFLLTSAVTFLAAFPSLAVPQNELLTSFSTVIEPWFARNAQRGEFKGVDQLVISYYRLPVAGSDCAVILSPGQGEPAYKYLELIYDLRDSRCSFFIMDQRGQGFSERVAKNHLDQTHVVRFQDYVDDFTTFMENVVQPQNFRRSVLIAHSMGGAIATGYLQTHPRSVSQVIELQPMIKIKTPFPELIALEAAKLLIGVGHATDFAPSQGGYNPRLTLDKDKQTHSALRFQLLRDLYARNEHFQMGGCSNQWAAESIAYTRKLRRQKNIFQVPTTIFQSAEDAWVLPEGQNQICAGSPDFCHVEILNGARHTATDEDDAVRTPLVEKIKLLIQAPQR
jgi:lysophospholipase